MFRTNSHLYHSRSPDDRIFLILHWTYYYRPFFHPRYLYSVISWIISWRDVYTKEARRLRNIGNHFGPGIDNVQSKWCEQRYVCDQSLDFFVERSISEGEIQSLTSVWCLNKLGRPRLIRDFDCYHATQKWSNGYLIGPATRIRILGTAIESSDYWDQIWWCWTEWDSIWMGMSWANFRAGAFSFWSEEDDEK